MRDIPNAPIEVINLVDKLFFLINDAQNTYKSKISSITGSRRYEELASNALSETKAAFVESIGELGIKLEDAQIDYLISNAGEEDINSLEVVIRSKVNDIMRKDITEDNLEERKNELKDAIFNSEIKYELKNVGLTVSDLF